MEIEDYFNFLATDDIRLKGTRVGIETILYEYIYNRKSPEAILELYYYTKSCFIIPFKPNAVHARLHGQSPSTRASR